MIGRHPKKPQAKAKATGRGTIPSPISIASHDKQIDLPYDTPL